MIAKWPAWITADRMRGVEWVDLLAKFGIVQISPNSNKQQQSLTDLCVCPSDTYFGYVSAQQTFDPSPLNNRTIPVPSCMFYLLLCNGWGLLRELHGGQDGRGGLPLSLPIWGSSQVTLCETVRLCDTGKTWHRWLWFPIRMSTRCSATSCDTVNHAVVSGLTHARRMQTYTWTRQSVPRAGCRPPLDLHKHSLYLSLSLWLIILYGSTYVSQQNCSISSIEIQAECLIVSLNHPVTWLLDWTEGISFIATHCGHIVITLALL